MALTRFAVLIAVLLAPVATLEARFEQSGSAIIPRQDPRRLPSPGSPEPPRADSVVIGTVIDATTGRGLPNAAVTLAGESRAFRIATDPLGRYFFVALPTGDYAISVAKAGYLPGDYGQLRPNGPAQALHLRPGEWRTDANVQMWRPAVISGVVLDEGGEPVIGAEVNALGREIVTAEPEIISTHSDTTDDQGKFRISDLPPGDYLVVAPFGQVTVPVASVEAVAQTGGVTGELTYVLFGGTATVNGAASANTVGSLMDAVSFSDDGHTMTVQRSTTSPPRKDGDAALAYRTQYFPSAESQAQAAPVSVGPGEEFAGVSFFLRPVLTATISGVVVGPDGPIDGQLLRLVPDTGQDFGEGHEVAATISDPDGAFEFPNVPRSTYVIEGRSARAVEALSAGPRRRPPSVTELNADPDELLRSANALASRELWSRTPVAATFADLAGLAIVMSTTLSANGDVVFAAGRPRPSTAAIESTRVSLKPASGGRAGVPDAMVGATGAFALQGLVPGDYFVTVVPPPGWFVESMRSGGRDLTRDPLEVGSSANPVAIAVTLTDTATGVEGTVRDARGMVVDRAAVLVIPSRGGRLAPLRTREVRVGPSGVFSIAGLPPGDYDVIAVDAAEVGGWRDPTRLTRLRAGATSVTLLTGGLNRVDLRLTSGR